MTADQRPAILIVDDREELLRFCSRVLGEDFDFAGVGSGADAQRLLKSRDDIAAVILDRDFSHADPAKLIGPPADVRNEGLHILRWLREERADLPALMVTGYREQRSAMEAAQMGTDYLAWSDIAADPHLLRAMLDKALHRGGEDAAQILERFRACGLVVESPRFAQMLCQLYRAIPGKAPLLILGETGTGKDHLASVIHMLSTDADRPYVNVNVSALTGTLIESELFGHARGAFTGAHRDFVGKLRHAHRGTLLLNEVAELSLDIQAKLLAVLEHKEVVPVGDVQAYPADFRLIAATCQDLRRRVEENRFRPDLFYRLAWHTVELPPLRERREDIPALVRRFLCDAGSSNGDCTVGIAREAMEYLSELPWPGNIRQLRAVIEAASALASYVITLTDVRASTARMGSLLSSAVADGGAQLAGSVTPEVMRHEESVFGALSLEEVKLRYFGYLLRKTGNNVPQAARLAGVAKATAYQWVERWRQ
jgi:DNA-binding NtrC family response regulator